ncbi:MAG: HAMP domain-containing histidine kinase [Chloroflexota bacterium]|nr:MAG: HAMP domain-containing histidine kinase [Chloroflexota bacterium]
MKWWEWILSLLPAGLGILVSILAINAIISNPVLFLRGSLAALASTIGVIVSIITIVALLVWNQNRRTKEDAIQSVKRQASEDRRRFLQRLDHELKNPLTAIQAGLTNITCQPLEEYVSEEVSAVQDQVLRVSRLVADLRKLAALEITPLEITTINMAELLTEVISTLEDQAISQDRRLSLILPNAPWPLPEIKGDPDLLLLAVHNLLDNAIKFTSPGDTIEVRAFDDGNEIVIEVADTGPGIPDQEIPRVWEELYRGEQARGVPGSGLGLPLVRAIIEKHGGNVGVRSKPDHGTLFIIRLPAD